MRWRTVDGIQTEERADTPLGEYRVKADGGRWAWYHESFGWAPTQTYSEAKRAAQQHFYADCAGRLARGPFCCSTETAIEKTLATIGIVPTPPGSEPLHWTPVENGGAFAHPRCDTAIVYLVRPVCCDRYAAYRRNGWDVVNLLSVGSFDQCKAACERDREANR